MRLWLWAVLVLILIYTCPLPLPPLLPPPFLLPKLLELAPALLGLLPPLPRNVPHLLGARLHRGERVIRVQPR